MKSNVVYNTDVLVHGAEASSDFKIAANGKAFKILIDGLYSNKIQAIVRELSSNAYDAQIAADRRDFAFEIQLPNILDPTFSVRDYGTSLSHEDIMGLYTTIFQSTKEDTNDAIGKFGLGSKTPFAYTDSFTVTAFLRGTKRVYGAYINVNGVPQISLMGSEDTSELDGLMVSFPVNAKDCERFRLETERVLEGFDVKPNVKGAQVSVERHGTPVWQGSNFKFYHGQTGARAKQGCVIYPIDVNALNSLTSMQLAVLKSNVLIEFPIGQLDITPSRETLSYDDVTIRNIIDMIDRIAAEVTKDISAQYAKVRTMYEARCFYADNKSSKIAPVTQFVNSLEFNGKKVSNSVAVYRDRNKKIYNVGIYDVSRYEMTYNKTIKFKGEKKYSDTLVIDKNTIFLIEDYRDPSKPVKLANARIRHNLEIDNKNIIWIRDYGATEKQMRSLKKLLGYPPKFYRLNDFELPPKKKPDPEFAEPRIARNEMRVELYNDTNSHRGEYIIDTNDLSGYKGYLLRHAGYFYVGDDPETDETAHSLTDYFPKLSEYLVVRKKDLKRIKKLGLTNALVDKRDELLPLIDFDMYNKSEARDSYLDHWLENNQDDLITLEYENDTSFKKMLDILRQYDKDEAIETTNSILLGQWSRLVTNSEFKKKVSEDTELDIKPEETLSYWVGKVIEDYPMLARYIPESRDKKFEEIIPLIVDYIKLVDNSKTPGA